MELLYNKLSKIYKDQIKHPEINQGVLLLKTKL